MVNSVGGDDGGEIVAVVELCLRQPDGWFPFNWLLLVSMGILFLLFVVDIIYLCIFNAWPVCNNNSGYTGV